MPDVSEGGFFRIASPVFFANGSFAAAMEGYITENVSLRKKRLLVRLVRKAAAEICRNVAEIELRRNSRSSAPR